MVDDGRRTTVCPLVVCRLSSVVRRRHRRAKRAIGSTRTAHRVTGRHLRNGMHHRAIGPGDDGIAPRQDRGRIERREAQGQGVDGKTAAILQLDPPRARRRSNSSTVWRWRSSGEKR